MKKLLILLLLAAPTPALANYKHELKTVVSGQLDNAYTHSKRIGSTYSFSSDGLTISALGGITGPASSDGSLTGVAATYGTNTFSHSGTGSASLTESFIQGDTVPSQTGVAVSSTTGATATLLTLGDVVTVAGGHKNQMAVALTQAGAISLTPGGSGSTISASISSVTEVN
tara:strand:+ start:440 stop:952 length:513 start_codon:yes stop_codon:yes gene_type:complete